MQIANNPLINQYDAIARSQSNPDWVTANFFNQVEKPQLASEAESQWLGGNLGTSGESTFGSNYLANQQAGAAAQSGLYGQQYVTNELNNLGGAVGNLLNERSNYFTTNLGLEQQQNNSAINEALNLNNQNLQAQTTNASNQLATNQLNQNGAANNAQLTQAGVAAQNQFGLSAAGQLNNFGLSAAQQLGNYNSNLMNYQNQANIASANNMTNLLTAPFRLLGGGIGALTGGSGGGGGSSSYGNGGSGIGNVLRSPNFGNTLVGF